MTKKLKQKLGEPASGVYSSFDIVGNIAIIKSPNENPENAKAAANHIMTTHKSVKTVFIQTSPILGEFRVRNLSLLAGENVTTTKHHEWGCVFAVDVEKCYFSPRLSFERMRIARLVADGETVVNMFAGVGCFSIVIAKKAANVKVYSIDVNPIAVGYMEENVKANKVEDKVAPLFGDAKTVITSQLHGIADRVLMPLPEKALPYLPYAVLALKKTGGWIHYHDFEHATGNEDPQDKTKVKVAQKLDALGVGYRFAFSRVIRSTGPNWYHTVADIWVDSLPRNF